MTFDEAQKIYIDAFNSLLDSVMKVENNDLKLELISKAKQVNDAQHDKCGMLIKK